MKAMILAAGRGSRMRPLTDSTPKPLLKVGGKSLIIWHIESLKKAGFEEIVINIAWLGDQIPQALGDGSRFGIKLIYSDEQHEGALETAGGIIKALPLLGDDPFLVVNGDVWSDYPYSNINPLQNDDVAHLVLTNNPKQHPEGDFSLNENRVAKNRDEKFTFTGIAYYHPKMFKNLPQGKLALLPLFIEKITEQKVSGELHLGDWRDIGTPERLQELDDKLRLIDSIN